MFTTTIGEDFEQAIHWLRAGETVAIPTETVYGLAANVLDPDAVVKIFQIKNRPAFNPLIVHVPTWSHFEKYATSIHPLLAKLAKQFSPGPLTYVLPKTSLVPDLVTAGGDTVALRIPAHPLTQQLLQAIDFPLAAPSANPFGYISPVTAQHVFDQLNGKLPYILDGGISSVGVESTVVTVEDDQVVVLRLGGVSVEALEAVVGKVKLRINQSSNPQSPGQLKSHYAPRTPLQLGILKVAPATYSRVAILAFQHLPNWSNCIAGEILSPLGDDAEAARNLFSALRKLDQCGAEVIFAELLPEKGLGMAINDRLVRAAAGN
jgi:L-threonylcarbamoyladenylate synthase